jgi:hypothetical protein
MSFKKIENDKISYIILPYNNYINDDIDINNSILKLKKKSKVYYEIIVGYFINELIIINEEHNLFKNMFESFINKNFNNNNSFIIFEKTHLSIIEDIFSILIPHDLYKITATDLYEYTDDNIITYLQYVIECDTD